MQWDPESRGQALTGKSIPMAFKDLAPQVSDCETLFLNLGSQKIITTVSASLLHGNFPSWSAGDHLGAGREFPRLMVLGDFNLPSLGSISEAAQKFMTLTQLK